MFIEIDNLLKAQDSIPEDLKSWLHHGASLTEKLKAQSGEAELQVLSQVWTQPNWWDKFTLGLTVAPVIHRDIVMYSHQIPCWFARTIIPNYSYHTNPAFFNRLQHESLGVIVFNEPSIKRIALLNYAINELCLEYHWLPDGLKANNKQFWLRLSVFTIADTVSFFLVEIFLPGLMRVVN